MSHKTATTSWDAWHVQEKYQDQPHGWIQWDGTDVCMDVYCACGAVGHLDVGFCYHVQCPLCGRVYFCNGHIELIELDEKPDHNVWEMRDVWPSGDEK